VKKSLLFVDDEQAALDGLRRALRRTEAEWQMTCVRDGEAAWQQLLDAVYDAVVTDVKMPGISGLELLGRIRRTPRTQGIPVVVLTGLSDHDLKRQALEQGASDLFTKPVDGGQLIARLNNVLDLKDRQDALRASVDTLRHQVDQQRRELLRTRLDAICRLANAAEYRDEETGNHVVRVGCYSRAVAETMGMDKRWTEMLLLAAPLHDIGKIGIPDRILLKPGPLTPAERAVIQRHCAIGERILREPSKTVVTFWDWYSPDPDAASPANPLLDLAASIALTHHEKWNGEGYPLGLAGESIPLQSRIVAVCDVFDALVSNRPYKTASSDDEALGILCDGVGNHFDPAVHRAFVKAWPEIRLIRRRFADGVRVLPAGEEERP